MLILIGAATMQTLSHPAEVHVRTQHDIRDWLCRQPPRSMPTWSGYSTTCYASDEGSPSSEMSGLLE